jgi:hypothetical protein
MRTFLSPASVNAQLGLGADNIASLRGINYSAAGGGNWMVIDYVQLNPPGATPPPTFLTPQVSNGKATLNWNGTANLEWAPAIARSVNARHSDTAKPYSEDVLPTQNRFYRLSSESALTACLEMGEEPLCFYWRVL